MTFPYKSMHRQLDHSSTFTRNLAFWINFSDPYSAYLHDIVNGGRVQAWGYQSAAGLGRSSDISSGNLYFLPRYEIRKDIKSAAFAAILPVAPVWIPTEPAPTVPAPTAAK